MNTCAMFSDFKKHFYANNEDLNIRHIFKPLYIVLSLFGLFPYSLKFHNNKKSLTIIKKSIYLNSLCAVSYMLLLFSFLALHVQYVYEQIGDTTMTREVLTQMNYILELVIFIIFCVTAYFCAFKNRATYVKIINKITSFTEPLNSNIEGAVKDFRNQMHIIMALLLIVILFQTAVNFSRDSSVWKMILVFASFMLPQTIQFTVIAFYYTLILMLMVLLKAIRDHINRISKEKGNVMGYVVKTETKILTLQNVEAMYSKAFEVKRDINKAFQAPLLITTIQCFHSIVSEAHIIYHGLVIERNFSVHSVVNCSIWIVYQIIKVYIMAKSGQLLKKEVTKIGQALHRIPTEKHDIRLLLEIQYFSSLITYQGDEITAYGLFALDAALLSKIIASSTMYITILVQFDKQF